MPSTNAVLLTNDIGVGVVQVYEMTLTYEDAEYDQSLDMNKTLEGKINIIDTSVTADIKGKLTNYEAGDYVQINSEPKKAYVDKDSKYKLIGVKAGSHTIGVYNVNNL